MVCIPSSIKLALFPLYLGIKYSIQTNDIVGHHPVRVEENKNQASLTLHCWRTSSSI